MLAKPCSSKVRDSEAITARSTTRCSGSSSGNPLSGRTGRLGHRWLQTSGRLGRGPAGGQVLQERVGRALAADRRLLAVAREHDDVVGSGSTLVARLRSIVGWSPPGRSVRPIEPAKSRSPENISSETSCSAYGVRKVTEPRVARGVVDQEREGGKLEHLLVGELLDIVGLGPLVVPPSSIWLVSRDMPAIGSVSRCRSLGWIHAVASYDPATGATHHMWSMWPWVTSTATGLSRCSRTTAATPSAASLPGSTTTHSEPGPVAAT